MRKQWTIVICGLGLCCGFGHTSCMAQGMVSELSVQSITDCNNSITIGWIAVKFDTHLHAPLRTVVTFRDHLTFLEASPAG